MDPRQKLKSILDQKKRLQQRITEIDNTDISQNKDDQQQLNQLLLRKKILQDQRKKQEEYLTLEKEYLQRKKQAERERQLQRIKNEKRMLELETAMKKVVFQGIKEKVKGMNSEQLMMRGFLSNTDQQPSNKNSSNSTFKDAFEGYLLQQPPQKINPKYDINKLNEKRLEIFQKKEQTVMKQILLKDLTASDESIEIDVLNMTREQLRDELERRGIDFQDFMHPVKKEDVINHYPQIKEQAQGRISEKKRGIAEERTERQAYERYRRQLRQEVNSLPFKSLQVVKRLLYDLFDEICDGYDKRHVNRTKEDQEQIAKKLQEEYDQLWNRNLVQELSQSIVEGMLQDIRKEMRRQSAQQISKLSQYSHQKTQECFRSVFSQGDLSSKLVQLSNYKFPLTFINEQENHVSKPKNDQYMKKLDKNESNVYETEENTVNLVNDIQLLSQEEKYMKNVKCVPKNQTQNKNQESIFVYDKVLYSVNRHGIKAVHSGKPYYIFSKNIDGIVRASKLNKNWLIQTQQGVTLVTAWNKEQIGCAIGGRISNPCGNITYSSIYPVLTFLGSPTSALLAFQKGQILKYNFNLNRITSRQTSITHYVPVIEHTKSGDEPAFPLDNRDYIHVQQEKTTKPTDEIHEFREFFQHHIQPIIFMEFYKIDKVVTIDRGLKCALWQYCKSRGPASFEPLFKFELRSSYKIYKQDQNPRYKDIFPVSTSKESPEQMYQSYMLTQSLLKMQLYNNPKKQIAYFRSPAQQQQEGEKAIWKITYKQSRRQVNKILESYYNVTEGGITAQQARIHNDTIYVLCYREHIIRNDLKTVKIYSWNIGEKRLGRVALQIDMYREQRVSAFLILTPGQGLRGVQMDLAVVVNSGRVLIFSLVSGQLLKNINDELSGERLYFKSVLSAADQGFLYGVANNQVMELHLEDINSINDRNKLNRTVDNVKRKFFR